MNELYGVDPAASAGAEELSTLIQKFGPSEGRFIVDFPGDWLTHAKAQLDSVPPMQRKRALACLWRFRHALIDTDRRFHSSRSWAENAVTLKDFATGLIGPRGCSAGLMPIDQALYEFDALPDSRGDHVPRNPASYVKASWPLFAISPKVVLVDWYFRLCFRNAAGNIRPDQRRRKVLLELLKEARRLRKVTTLCLQVSGEHALVGDSEGSRFESDLRKIAEEAGSPDLVIEYGLMDEDDEAKQHARYLLGTGCGLHFDHGFDAPSDASRNHVHWLSATELRPLLKKFNLPDA